MSDKVKIAIIKVYVSDNECNYCYEHNSYDVFQYGVENWLEIDRNDVYKYLDSINKANSYRDQYRTKRNYKYILIEQSSDMIEFAYKDANEFVKKQEAREKKWKQQNEEREKKAAESKIKREVARVKKNLKKLNFSQEEIDAKILETYGKEFI